MSESFRMWAWVRQFVFIGYAAVWTTLLLVPDPAELFGLRDVVPESVNHTTLPVDKVVHMVGYLTLGVLALGAFGSGPINFPYRWIVVACAAHGALTELGQMIVPPREASVADWFADIAGVGMGTLIFGLGRRVWRLRTNRKG